jgi:lipopolysaccharide biosynthesis protein
MMRLRKNRQNCDLFISTTATEKVKGIRAATQDYENGKVERAVVPNKGRDIGAFLVDLSTHFDEYDVVGHVHGKRSVIDGDNSMGERWRNFLWTNLIGNNETS